MNLFDINQLDVDKREVLPFSLDCVEDINGHLCINGKVAIPITQINRVFDRTKVINVVDEGQESLGLIYFTSSKSSFNLENLTEGEFIAYLTEVSSELFLMEEYRFLYDYIVLDKSSLNRYMEKFHNTSAIWGQFLHKEQDRLRSHIREVSQIVAVSDIELPTMYHNEIAIRLIKEPFAFERFLKNYHLIELLFDYDLVNNIKQLDDDLKGIGKLLSQYSSKEFNRLIYVLGGRINSIPSLEVQLNNIDSFMSKAKVIFYDYGKDYNPLKIEDLENINLQGGFSFEVVKNVVNRNMNFEKYKVFLIKITCYWIYRIRCCIAHNKIGEFIFDSSDEEFVSNFGECLIEEVIKQCFKRVN